MNVAFVDGRNSRPLASAARESAAAGPILRLARPRGYRVHRRRAHRYASGGSPGTAAEPQARPVVMDGRRRAARRSRAAAARAACPLHRSGDGVGDVRKRALARDRLSSPPLRLSATAGCGRVEKVAAIPGGRTHRRTPRPRRTGSSVGAVLRSFGFVLGWSRRPKSVIGVESCRRRKSRRCCRCAISWLPAAAHDGDARHPQRENARAAAKWLRS